MLAADAMYKALERLVAAGKIRASDPTGGGATTAIYSLENRCADDLDPGEGWMEGGREGGGV